MGAKTQQQYAETFHGLHRKGDPLVLFNAWDVATAKAIPGARLMIVDGMGHDLPEAAWPRLVPAIADHAHAADRTASAEPLKAP